MCSYVDVHEVHVFHAHTPFCSFDDTALFSLVALGMPNMPRPHELNALDESNARITCALLIMPEMMSLVGFLHLFPNVRLDLACTHYKHSHDMTLADYEQWSKVMRPHVSKAARNPCVT